MALAILSGGCSSTSGQLTGTGGSSSGGGNGTGTGGNSSGGSGPGSCTNGSSCGGSVVGNWSVNSSCLTLGGTLDVAAAGLDPSSCKNVTISGSLNVTGTFSTAGDGTYKDGTTTSGTATMQLPAGCLQISGTTTTCKGISGPLAGLGFGSVNCTDASSGGGCTCTGTIQQTGGIGTVSVDPQTSGNYTTSGGTLSLDGSTDYDYCVSNGQLTLTPKPAGIKTTGSMVLKSGGSTGTGGVVGTGGTGTGGNASGGAGGRGNATGGAGGRGAGGTNVGGTTGATGGSGGAQAAGTGPCDIYAAAGDACAAAYSPVRVLNSKYTGFLYQVRKGSSSMNLGTGGTTMDIGAVNGYADSATQDAFCSGSTCTFSIIYDQSGNGNNLKVAPAGCYNDGSANTPDYESSATKRSLMINGHKVYALYMNAHEGYRNNATKGMPLKQTDEGIYEIADGKRIGAACCWDFGNAGTDNCNGSVMNTIFFGTGFWGTGAGNGPWFLGDFEGGVWAGGSGASNANNPMNPSMGVDYAVGILKTSGSGSSAQYAIRVANGQSGGITTAYDGKSPKGWDNKGGIILGIGGDNSNHSLGTFFEGAITTGRPSDATDALILANIQAAGYGK
ncbi:MAG: arabinofuranosidase catalytic domain-containing protein [Polyangia bacterium]